MPVVNYLLKLMLLKIYYPAWLKISICWMQYLKSIASTTKAWFNHWYASRDSECLGFCDFVYKGLVQLIFKNQIFFCLNNKFFYSSIYFVFLEPKIFFNLTIIASLWGRVMVYNSFKLFYEIDYLFKVWHKKILTY